MIEWGMGFSTFKLYNSDVKFLGSTTSSGKVVYVYVQMTNVKNFRNLCIFTHFTIFSVHPSTDTLCSEQLYLRNGCID